MSSRIDLVIFDMDDVLARLDRGRRLHLLAEMTGKPAAFIHERIWASDFESSAERGSYPLGDEYLAEFNRRIDANLTRDQWVRARREASHVNTSVLAIAASLQQHVQIAVLTNNGSLLRESLAEILPDVAALFGSRAHASCQFNSRKPESLVFTRMLEHYGISPSRAVFIDDLAEFVAGARSVGMHGIQFEGANALKQSLAALNLWVE